MGNQLAMRIIRHFSQKNVLAFNIQDVRKIIPEKRPEQLSRILRGMVEKEMLFRISRNSYHIIPLNEDPETYTPDAHHMAKYLMRDEAYYIGYASAMKLHGLMPYSEPGQSHHVEYVVTSKQKKPAIRDIKGTTYKFIRHSDTRFFAFTSMWINSLEKVMVSDLEKTIVDIAAKPQFCGGVTGLGKALIKVNRRVDYEKLFFYFARNANITAKKRFLYLGDLLGFEWTPYHEKMMEELGSGISLLDPSAPMQGKNRYKFGLKINVDPILIKNSILADL